VVIHNASLTNITFITHTSHLVRRTHKHYDTKIWFFLRLNMWTGPTCAWLKHWVKYIVSLVLWRQLWKIVAQDKQEKDRQYQGYTMAFLPLAAKRKDLGGCWIIDGESGNRVNLAKTLVAVQTPTYQRGISPLLARCRWLPSCPLS